jgi:hypothetical protein
MTEETAAPVEGQAAPAGTQAASWVETLPEDMRGYVETKGFKDPAAVLTSYMNLEKLRGVPEDRLLKLPEKMDADALAPVYDKLGRPEAADKYTRALGEEFHDGVFKSVAETAHKLGLSDAQFTGLQKIMSEQATGLKEQQDAQAAQAFDQWKAQNGEGFNAAARVMANVGMDEAGLEALLSGDKTALYGFLAKVAARSSEGKIIHGDQPGAGEFGVSPAGAKQKISELFADKTFMEQYTSTNAKVRQPAIDRMMRLQEIASKGA